MDNFIIITPVVNCSFDEEKLRFPFTLSLPTCFTSSRDDTRIDVRL